MDGCGTDCFLSVSFKNTVFSKWITDVVISLRTFRWGNSRTVTFDLGTLCLRRQGSRHRDGTEAAESSLACPLLCWPRSPRLAGPAGHVGLR